MKLLTEACLIQESGGMQVNGRFRTAGGVFFHLVRKSKQVKAGEKKRILRGESQYWSAEAALCDELAKLDF